IEFGELSVNHEWQRVDFAKTFADPIVTAKSFSRNGGQSATVRIDGVDETGFWIRIQEWDYLDGTHARETITYVAIERGQHQLPNGTWIEADSLDVSAADAFYRQSLIAPFSETPIVIAAVASDNDTHAVTTRLRNATQSSFEVALQEQEASSHRHETESVTYIAWEPSIGQIDGLAFEVAQAQESVTHLGSRVDFTGAYDEPPAVLADMQTRNGGDTAVLRWSYKDAASMDVWVQEEQSKDSEVGHAKESVGYILLSNSGSDQP
ncbi:fibronectin type III domain-containing protein, partial [Thiorhodococcus mannitoliphagus]